MTVFTPSTHPDTFADMINAIFDETWLGNECGPERLIELGFDRVAVNDLYDAADRRAGARLAGGDDGL